MGLLTTFEYFIRGDCRSHLTVLGMMAAIVSIAVLTSCTAEDGDGQDRPNIIIIYADDVGYGDIGAYGAKHLETPNIDRLSREGIRFTNAYATSAMCTPSRYSLLTGRYAFRHESAGILSAEDPLIIEPGMTTLPSMLQSAGYKTSIVGKWHLGLGSEDEPINWSGKIIPGPLETGFDESFILPVTNDRVPTVFVEGHQVYGLNAADDSLRVAYPEEGHHDYQEQQFGEEKAGRSQVPQPLVGDLPSGHTHPEQLRYPADAQHSGTIVNGVSRIGYQAGGQSAWWDDEQMSSVFLERSKRFVTENQDNPFFLFLSMPENHVPRIPNSNFEGSSPTGLRGDAVHELDWVVGQVISKLEELGIRDETMIIFTSDNGPVFYDGYEDGALEDHNGHDPSGPFRGGKYIAYEGGTRMPTIVSWPDRIKSGTESNALISQVDLLASLSELVGVEIFDGDQLDSENILPALLGESTAGRELLVQQSSDGLALRQGSWKYIEAAERSDWAYNRHNLGDTPLNVEPLDSIEYLFNLEDDMEERKNLAEEYPEKLKEMRSLMKDIKQK